MTNRNNKKQQTRDSIYKAAISLICEQGYKETTLVDIADEANVSTRTLYRYYPTKEAILKQFCQENLLELKEFTKNLSPKLPLKEQVLQTMVEDYTLMFSLFDTSSIVHFTAEHGNSINKFEMTNVLEAESIYCYLFKNQQLRWEITPNDNIKICASIVVAIYRHCNDLIRFRSKIQTTREVLYKYYSPYIDLVWPSIEKTLANNKSEYNLE